MTHVIFKIAFCNVLEFLENFVIKKVFMLLLKCLIRICALLRILINFLFITVPVNLVSEQD